MHDADDSGPTPGWATASGTVAVGHQQADIGLRYGHQRTLIAERIARYGWSFDERDRDGLADCFTPDGVWEGHIMGTDTVGPFTGREEVTEFLAQFWEVQTDQRRHLFTNIVTDGFSSESGSVTAHAYLLLTSSQGGSMTPLTAGPYRFVLEEGDDGAWRIAHLTAGFDAPF